jgi:hypothetical protein
MRHWRLAAILSGLAWAAVGCSFLLDFDPEGQPCNPERLCSDGFRCVGEVCVRSLDACGGCQTGERCLPATLRCVPDTCEHRRCAVGHACIALPGGSECRPIPTPQLGHPCLDDAQCSQFGANRICYRGLAVTDAGTPRPGACLERCALDLPCQGDAGICTAFPHALDAGAVHLCVPRHSLGHCQSNAACLDEGMRCTALDHPKWGPVTVCDAPAASGTDACAIAGRPCANGLCLQSPSGASCSEVCSEESCGTGQLCLLHEVTFRGVARHLPLCAASATRCTSCLGAPERCGSDAPHCAQVGGSFQCVSSCTPAAGSLSLCPPGLECVEGDGGSYCLAASTCQPN